MSEAVTLADNQEVFYCVKTKRLSNSVSLADSDKSKATGRALTVKTDTVVLISTKDNEM